MANKEKDCISRQVGQASLQIDYEYRVTDSVRHAHMVLLEKYWKNFKESDVFIWVPDGADEECEYGVYPACKEITLTNADAAKEAFGADWMEEHIFTATITWAIPDGEYDRLVKVNDDFVEQDRINRMAAGGMMVQKIDELKREFAKLHFAMKNIDATQTTKEHEITAWDTPLAKKKELSAIILSLNSAWITGCERKTAIKEELAALESEL